MSTYHSSSQDPATRGGVGGRHDSGPPLGVDTRPCGLVIRRLETVDEYHACERLQYRVWAMADDLEIVPLHLLVTAQENGGFVLGAFDRDQLIGFVFGFPGLDSEGRLKHCSHMMGVAPEAQSCGIGYRLKLAQRELVLAQGLELVTWTYDPLESLNAYLNLHKLGAVCREYVRDLYGALRNGLNAGLPTDRFEVEWWINSERVLDRLATAESQENVGASVRAIGTGRASGGWVTPDALTLDSDAPMVQVEIPANYRLLKSADPSLAFEWRQATRRVFEFYFSAGYTAVDFVSQEAGVVRCSFYVLQAD